MDSTTTFELYSHDNLFSLNDLLFLHNETSNHETELQSSPPPLPPSHIAENAPLPVVEDKQQHQEKTNHKSARFKIIEDKKIEKMDWAQFETYVDQYNSLFVASEERLKFFKKCKKRITNRDAQRRKRQSHLADIKQYVQRIKELETLCGIQSETIHALRNNLIPKSNHG